MGGHMQVYGMLWEKIKTPKTRWAFDFKSFYIWGKHDLSQSRFFHLKRNLFAVTIFVGYWVWKAFHSQVLCKVWHSCPLRNLLWVPGLVVASWVSQCSWGEPHEKIYGFDGGMQKKICIAIINLANQWVNVCIFKNLEILWYLNPIFVRSLPSVSTTVMVHNSCSAFLPSWYSEVERPCHLFKATSGQPNWVSLRMGIVTLHVFDALPVD